MGHLCENLHSVMVLGFLLTAATVTSLVVLDAAPMTGLLEGSVIAMPHAGSSTPDVRAANGLLEGSVIAMPHAGSSTPDVRAVNGLLEGSVIAMPHAGSSTPDVRAANGLLEGSIIVMPHGGSSTPDVHAANGLLEGSITATLCESGIATLVFLAAITLLAFGVSTPIRPARPLRRGPLVGTKTRGRDTEAQPGPSRNSSRQRATSARSRGASASRARRVDPNRPHHAIIVTEGMRPFPPNSDFDIGITSGRLAEKMIPSDTQQPTIWNTMGLQHVAERTADKNYTLLRVKLIERESRLQRRLLDSAVVLIRAIEVAMKVYPCNAIVMCRAPRCIHVEGSVMHIAAHEKATHGAQSGPKDLKGQMRREAQLPIAAYPPNLGATCSLCSIVSLLIHLKDTSATDKFDEATDELKAVMNQATWDNTAALAVKVGWNDVGTRRMKPFHRGQFLFQVYASIVSLLPISLFQVMYGKDTEFAAAVNNNRGKPADVPGYMETMATQVTPKGHFVSIQTVDATGSPVGINKRSGSFVSRHGVYELRGFVGVTGYNARPTYLEPAGSAQTIMSVSSTPASTQQTTQSSQPSRAGDDEDAAVSTTATIPPEATSAVASSNLGHAIAYLKVDDDGPPHWIEVDGQDERKLPGDPPFHECALAMYARTGAPPSRAATAAVKGPIRPMTNGPLVSGRGDISYCDAVRSRERNTPPRSVAQLGEDEPSAGEVKLGTWLKEAHECGPAHQSAEHLAEIKEVHKTLKRSLGTPCFQIARDLLAHWSWAQLNERKDDLIALLQALQREHHHIRPQTSRKARFPTAELAPVLRDCPRLPGVPAVEPSTATEMGSAPTPGDLPDLEPRLKRALPDWFPTSGQEPMTRSREAQDVADQLLLRARCLSHSAKSVALALIGRTGDQQLIELAPLFLNWAEGPGVPHVLPERVVAPRRVRVRFDTTPRIAIVEQWDRTPVAESLSDDGEESEPESVHADLASLMNYDDDDDERESWRDEATPEEDEGLQPLGHATPVDCYADDLDDEPLYPEPATPGIAEDTALVDYDEEHDALYGAEDEMRSLHATPVDCYADDADDEPIEAQQAPDPVPASEAPVLIGYDEEREELFGTEGEVQQPHVMPVDCYADDLEDEPINACGESCCGSAATGGDTQYVVEAVEDDVRENAWDCSEDHLSSGPVPDTHAEPSKEPASFSSAGVDEPDNVEEPHVAAGMATSSEEDEDREARHVEPHVTAGSEDDCARPSSERDSGSSPSPSDDDPDLDAEHHKRTRSDDEYSGTSVPPPAREVIQDSSSDGQNTPCGGLEEERRRRLDAINLGRPGMESDEDGVPPPPPAPPAHDELVQSSDYEDEVVVERAGRLACSDGHEHYKPRDLKIRPVATVSLEDVLNAVPELKPRALRDLGIGDMRRKTLSWATKQYDTRKALFLDAILSRCNSMNALHVGRMVVAYLDNDPAEDLPYIEKQKFTRNKGGNVSCITLNCRSLTEEKAAALAGRLHYLGADVAFLTEIWDPAPAARAALAAAGYSGQWRTRTTRQGGGTAVLVNTTKGWGHRTCDPAGTDPDGRIEVTHCRIIPPGGRLGVHDRVVSAIYCAPDDANHPAPTKEQWVDALKCGEESPSIIGGDVNALHRSWNPSGVTNSQGRTLHRALRDVELTPCALNHPTRGANGLDIIAVSPGMIAPTALVHDAPAASFDHKMVHTEVFVGALPAPTTSHRHVDWKNITAAQKQAFVQRLEGAIGEVSPKASQNIMNAKIHAAIHQASAVLPWRRSRVTPVGLSAWSDPEGEFRKYINKMDIHKLWKRLDGAAPVQQPPDTLAEDLAAVSRRSEPGRPEPDPPPEPPPPVEPEEVRAAITRHNLKGCRDPHGISPPILRLVAESQMALEALAKLFTKANASGSVPDAWRRSDIVPLHKHGKDPNASSSWRPVALTALVCRTWERVVLLRMEPRLQATLDSDQAAYRRGHSATALVTRMRTLLMKALSWKQQPAKREPRVGNFVNHRGILFALDASSAFNGVPIDRLQELLEPYKEGPAIVSWLRGRSQRLRGDTDWLSTTSGVPQGSVLGPVLWCLFLDDILKKAKAKSLHPENAHQKGLHAFADDVHLWLSGRSESSMAAGMSAWSKMVTDALTGAGIPVSNKSRSLLLSRGDPMELSEIAGFSASTAPMKVLGVMQDADLSGEAQQNAVCHAVAKLLERLRTLSTLGVHPFKLKQLYHTYVIPKFVYGAASILDLGWNSKSPQPENRAYPGAATIRPGETTNLSTTTIQQWETLHNEACRIITGALASAPTTLVVREAGFEPLEWIIQRKCIAEDEKMVRTYPTWAKESQSEAPAPRRDLLTSLPYEPAHAARHVSSVSFISDIGRGLHRESEKARKREDNQRRLGRAPSDTAILASDGSSFDVGENENDKERHGGAGAALWSPSGTLLGERLVSAPKYSCSYTGECEGAIAALDLALDTDPQHDIIVWKIDNRGLVEALAAGPLLQRGHYEAEIWKRLIYLSEKGRKIHIVWVFSHCDDPHNDHVDALAKKAADELFPREKEHREIWHVDARRRRANIIIEPKRKERLADIKKGHPLADITPHKIGMLRHVHPQAARTVMALRIGVWAPTGYEKDVTQECPHCREQIPGRRPGILHALGCTQLNPLDQSGNPLAQVSEKMLWGTVEQQMTVLKRALAWKAARA